MDKKNILIILPWLPYPFSSGGNQAMYNGIAAIRNKANVTVVYIDYNRDQHIVDRNKMTKLLDNVEIIPFIYSNRNTKWKFINWLFDKFGNSFCGKNGDFLTDRMYLSYKPLPSEYIDFIGDIVTRKGIEIVQMEMIATLPLVLSLPETVKKVFVHHEIRYVFNELYLKNIGETIYRQANLAIAKIMEVGLLKKCDAIIALSQTDKEKLMAEGIRENKIFPSIAVVNSIAEGKVHTISHNILSFVGAETHIPNQVGIKWFLENCWGKLQNETEPYQLRIIGKWSKATIKQLTEKYKNIYFPGYIENLSDILSNTIMIVPITIGSGIRMKILEAASIGIPFVSTTIGAEGLPFINEENCFLADTPEAFVEGILKLKNANLRRKFAESSMVIIKDSYSIEALGANRMSIYSVVSSGSE